MEYNSYPPFREPRISYYSKILLDVRVKILDTPTRSWCICNAADALCIVCKTRGTLPDSGGTEVTLGHIKHNVVTLSSVENSSGCLEFRAFV